MNLVVVGCWLMLSPPSPSPLLGSPLTVFSSFVQFLATTQEGERGRLPAKKNESVIQIVYFATEKVWDPEQIF